MGHKSLQWQHSLIFLTIFRHLLAEILRFHSFEAYFKSKIHLLISVQYTDHSFRTRLQAPLHEWRTIHWPFDLRHWESSQGHRHWAPGNLPVPSSWGPRASRGPPHNWAVGKLVWISGWRHRSCFSLARRPMVARTSNSQVEAKDSQVWPPTQFYGH